MRAWGVLFAIYMGENANNTPHESMEQPCLLIQTDQWSDNWWMIWSQKASTSETW